MHKVSLSKLSGLTGRWQKLTKGLLALTAGLALTASALAHTVSIGHANAVSSWARRAPWLARIAISNCTSGS